MSQDPQPQPAPVPPPGDAAPPPPPPPGPSAAPAPKAHRVLPWSLVAAMPLGYALYIVAAQLYIGVSYEELSYSTRNILLAVAAPVAVGCVLLAVLTTVLGWWPQVWRDDRPLRPWLALLPAGMAVAAVANIDYPALRGLGWAYIGAAALATLLVGFSEELLTRGLIVVGVRHLASERWAWFWSSFIFGILHILTALAGRALPLSLGQAVAAFFIGTVLYLARRAAGTLLAPILLHAVWDFALFTEIGARFQGLPINYAGLASWFLIVIALLLATLVAIVQIVRGHDRPAAPAPQAATQ